ncbi:MAG: hypothetical protein M3Z21_08865, partial [Pseudomonadota bacterium]|nr:hypothetical protein [Pseudomonadota bacterium]
MNDQSLRLQIGKRLWEVLLLPGDTLPEQIAARLATASPPPDLVLIPNPRVEQPAAWNAAARDCFGDDGDAAVLASPDLARWGMAPAASLLVLGRQRFVERFRRETAPDSSPSPPAPPRSARSPAALEPAGCPPFAEAQHLDPLASDPQRLRAAWSRAFALLGRLAGAVHRRGVAVTWPMSGLWGYADADYKPWRTVATLDGSEPPAACPVAGGRQPPFAEDEAGELLMAQYFHWMDAAYRGRSQSPAAEDGAEATAPCRPSRGRELPLALLQRLLLGLHADSGSPPASAQDWSAAAEWLEELGYLAVSCSYVLSFPGGLKKFLDAGLLLGLIHE